MRDPRRINDVKVKVATKSPAFNINAVIINLLLVGLIVVGYTYMSGT